MAGRKTGADKPTKVRGDGRQFPFPVEAKLGPYPLPRQVSHLHHPVGIDHALSPPSILVLQVSQCVAGLYLPELKEQDVEAGEDQRNERQGETPEQKSPEGKRG